MPIATLDPVSELLGEPGRVQAVRQNDQPIPQGAQFACDLLSERTTSAIALGTGEARSGFVSAALRCELGWATNSSLTAIANPAARAAAFSLSIPMALPCSFGQPSRMPTAATEGLFQPTDP